jgi:hypothetical protein
MNQKNRNMVLLAVAVLIWAAVTPFMWRDLERRPQDQIRGKKWMWWIASFNLSGSLAYLLFGRRTSD